MISRATAEVGAGQHMVNVELRLPNGGPLSPHSDKFECQLLSLHAQVTREQMEYKMTLKIKRQEDKGRVYSKWFNDPFAKGATPLTMSTKVNKYNQKAAEGFSYSVA
jgi:hypothetical protein